LKVSSTQPSEKALGLLLAGLLVVLGLSRLGLSGATRLVVFLGGAVFLGAIELVRRAVLGDPSPKGSARKTEGWARRGQLRRLIVYRRRPERLVLGRLGRRLVAAEPGQSLLVLGPSQSGKTSRLALPALLEWEGPVLATSVKGDLAAGGMAARSVKGEVALFDPTGSTGLESAGWSPLTAASSWARARELAASFTSLGRLEGGLEDAGYWYAAAERVLAPLLRAAHLAGGTMSQVLSWLEEEGAGVPLGLLSSSGEIDAARMLGSVASLEERQRSSIYSTAHSVVAAYGDPAVAASELTRPAVGPDWLFSGGPRTLFLASPARTQARLAPVFTALVRQVVDRGYELAARTGALSEPLLVLLDEAANIAPLEDLDQLVATSVGHRITFLTIWQDLAQIEARYGARAATIVNNHRGKVVFPGLSDPRSLELLTSLIGEGERPEQSVSRSGGNLTTTTSHSRLPLAPAAFLRQLEPGSVLLLYGSLPPALLSSRRPAATAPVSRRWPRFEAGSGPAGRC
jgi:type IV secretion system protein VirD4